MPKGKRAPAGSRASIPRDTILSADPEGVLVETPVMSTLVLSTPPWPTTISVDAWKLVGLCDTHKKLRGKDKAIDKIIIGAESEGFFVMYGNTKLSLPILR